MGDSMPPVNSCVENDIAFTIATDFNPNCQTLSMPFIGSLAVQRCGIDPLTALVAATRNPATGIVRDDGLEQGVLKAGAVANLNVLKANSWESWCLQPGVSPIHSTFISGKPAGIEKT
jgi:imidazolonepropionase-like amidohydrolase